MIKILIFPSDILWESSSKFDYLKLSHSTYCKNIDILAKKVNFIENYQYYLPTHNLTHTETHTHTHTHTQKCMHTHACTHYIVAHHYIAIKAV